MEPVPPDRCVPVDSLSAPEHPTMPKHLRNADLWLCPNDQALSGLMDRRDRSPTPEPWREDPLTIQDGLKLYERAVKTTAMMTRIVPLLFVETPRLGPEQVAWLEENPTEARVFREMWSARGAKQWRRMGEVRRRLAHNKTALRHMLLRDGTFYVEDTQVARYAFRNLKIQHFFDDPTVWLARGETLFELERKGDRYVFAYGPRAGAPARLVLHDRITHEPATLQRRQAWDLDALRRAAGLRRLEVTNVTWDLLEGTAILRSGLNAPARALRVDGRLVLALLAPPVSRHIIEPAITAGIRDAVIAEGLVLTGDQFADDRLRFDEPRTEFGQQDGSLRHAWRRAYLSGESEYTFNEDRYPVFNSDGTPWIPQVCVDFVLDLPERWAGTWYTSRGQSPERTRGFLDFDDYDFSRRKVSSLVRFAKENPDKILLQTMSSRDRVPFEKRRDFYAVTRRLADRVLTGDTVVIYGLRDDERNHWHSFMVYATDPMGGRPIVLMGNAGTARIRVWYDVMRTAPRRSIRYLLRFRPEWLTTLESGTSAWIQNPAQ